MKKHTMTIVIIATIIFSVGLLWWAKANQTKEVNSPNSNIISMRGIHYHPKLSIFVNGNPIEIPQNVGLVGGHQPIHTHDDVPIIHLEFPARVTKEDTRLGNFFEVWGKDFKSFGQNVTMTVNDEPNTEFENYQMRDGDNIVLRYE